MSILNFQTLSQKMISPAIQFKSRSLIFKSLPVYILFFCLAGSGFTESHHRLLKDADEAYLNEDFKSAEQGNRKAVKKKRIPEGNYNMGNAIYKQKRFELPYLNINLQMHLSMLSTLSL